MTDADLDKLEALAKAAAADNTNPDYFAAVQSLDLLHRECTPEAILDLIASARRDAEEIERLRGALKPFADFADNIDAEGWTSNIHKERISYWFGPSDFRAARAAHTGEG